MVCAVVEGHPTDQVPTLRPPVTSDQCATCNLGNCAGRFLHDFRIQTCFEKMLIKSIGEQLLQGCQGELGSNPSCTNAKSISIYVPTFWYRWLSLKCSRKSPLDLKPNSFNDFLLDPSGPPFCKLGKNRRSHNQSV